MSIAAILMHAFKESQQPVIRQVFIGPNTIRRSDKKRGGGKHDKYQGTEVSKKVGKTESKVQISS